MNLDHITPDLRPLAKPIDDYYPDPTNARTGHDVERIAASLKKYGQRTSIVINRQENGKIEKGNGTWRAAKFLGWSHIAVVREDDDPVTAVSYGIDDNRTGDLSEWDLDILEKLIDSLPDDALVGFKEGEAEALLEGMDDDEEYDGQVGRDPSRPSLVERFVVPPFSVLDARKGYWQDRKRAWLSLGIQSELGRGAEIAPGGSLLPAATIINGKIERGDGRGRTLGAIAPNEGGDNGILASPGKYAAKKRGGG